MIYGDTVQKLNVTVDADGGEYFTAIPQLLAIRQAGNFYVYGVNNPIRHVDSSGKFAKELQQKTIFDGTGGGGLESVVFWGLLSIVVGTIGRETAELVEIVKTWVESEVNEMFYRGHSVYVLRNEAKLVQYVGRSNDPDRRLAEHRRDPKHNRKNYDMKVVISGLTESEAKLFEQFLISVYTRDYLENARREIAVGNIHAYDAYIDSIQNIFRGAAADIITELLLR